MEQNGDVMGVMNMEAAEDAPSWIRVRVLRSRAPSCKIFTLPTQASRVYYSSSINSTTTTTTTSTTTPFPATIM